MDTPTHVPKKILQNERSSSHQLFETLVDLNSERKQSDNAHDETVSDKNMTVLQLEMVIASLENKFPELAFTLGHNLGNNKKILVVTYHVLAKKIIVTEPMFYFVILNLAL